MNQCKDCRYALSDTRETVYRRGECWFCRRKGPHFSRQYRVGEGTRISPESPACPDFLPAPKTSPES